MQANFQKLATQSENTIISSNLLLKCTCVHLCLSAFHLPFTARSKIYSRGLQELHISDKETGFLPIVLAATKYFAKKSGFSLLVRPKLIYCDASGCVDRKLSIALSKPNQ